MRERERERRSDNFNEFRNIEAFLKKNICDQKSKISKISLTGQDFYIKFCKLTSCKLQVVTYNKPVIIKLTNLTNATARTKADRIFQLG